MIGFLDHLLGDVRTGLSTIYGNRLSGVYLFGLHARTGLPTTHRFS